MKKIVLLSVILLSIASLSNAQNKSRSSIDIYLQGAFNIPLSDSMKSVMNPFAGIHTEAQLNLTRNFSVLLGVDVDFITFKQDFVNTLIGTGEKTMAGSKQISFYIGPKYFFHISKNNDFRSFISLAAGSYTSSLGDYSVTNTINNQKVTSTYVTSSTTQTGINLGAGFDYILDENFLFAAGVKYHKVFGKDKVTVTSTINSSGYAYTTNLQPYSYFTISAGLGYRIKF